MSPAQCCFCTGPGWSAGPKADLFAACWRACVLAPTSRRENQLKLSHDWLCYLAPEIVREMTPGKDEDQLPFSKAADVYAFG